MPTGTGIPLLRSSVSVIIKSIDDKKRVPGTAVKPETLYDQTECFSKKSHSNFNSIRFTLFSGNSRVRFRIIDKFEVLMIPMKRPAKINGSIRQVTGVNAM